MIPAFFEPQYFGLAKSAKHAKNNNRKLCLPWFALLGVLGALGEINK